MIPNMRSSDEAQLRKCILRLMLCYSMYAMGYGAERYSMYGMAWYGVVWCGIVWYGMVWCGVVWCGMVW